MQVPRPRAAGLLAALVTAGLLPATGAPAAIPADPQRAAIQSLLDSRAAAVLARDRRAFMAAVSDDSPRFAARQRRLFENLERVPFASYRLLADWGRFGDLSRPSEVRRYAGADDVVITVVEERYRLRGFDSRDAVEDLYLTFVARSGEWSVAEDTDLDELGLWSARHPWDFDPVTVERTGRFMFLRPAATDGRSCAPAPPDLIGAAATALGRVDEQWQVRWPRKVVFVMPCSPDDLERMLQATFDVSKFVAFAYSTIDPARDGRYGGHRIFVNPPVFAGRPAEQVQVILAHELLHIATRKASGPFAPLFVEEGYAEVVGHAGDPGALAFLEAVVDAGGFDYRLPRDFEFSTGTGNEIFLSYQEAYSAIAFFIERWGGRAFVRFYRTLGRERVAPGLMRWHVDRALRSTIGMGLAAFEKAWASSIAG